MADELAPVLLVLLLLLLLRVHVVLRALEEVLVLVRVLAALFLVHDHHRPEQAQRPRLPPHRHRRLHRHLHPRLRRHRGCRACA